MRKFIVIIFITLLTLIILKFNQINKIEYIKENYLNEKSNVYILTIDKLDLKEIVKTNSIYNSKINGIVMFKEFGRPNKTNTNTILGAHSGAGRNAFFANLEKINIGDKLKFYYEKIEYNYSVINKFYVHENDLSILNNIKEKTTLTLLTCKKFNNKYRLIVILELIDFI